MSVTGGNCGKAISTVGSICWKKIAGPEPERPQNVSEAKSLRQLRVKGRVKGEALVEAVPGLVRGKVVAL